MFAAAARPERRTWWTRERVLAALGRFHREFGVAPLSSEEYQKLQTTTGSGNSGPARPYPSCNSVLRRFRSFREAWEAAGVHVDRGHEPWSELEDWYLREGAGILTRKELAADLRRTENSVHRRLYDRGIHSYRNHGWTLHRVERVAQIPRHLLDKYLVRGDLPSLRGSKAIYVDPADLLAVEEIDWEHPPEELERDVRRSLAQRMAAVLSGRDWREGRIYRAERVLKTDRRYRWSAVTPSPRPTHLDFGDTVRVVRDVPDRPGVLGREGVVRLVYWSRQRPRPRDARSPARETPEPGWFARVEFPKIKAHGNDRPRVIYSLRVEALARPNEGPAAAPGIGEAEHVVTTTKTPRARRCEPGKLAARLDAMIVELRDLGDALAELEEAAGVLAHVRRVLGAGAAERAAAPQRRKREAKSS